MKTLLLILCFAAHTAFATPEQEEKDSVIKIDRTIAERFFNDIPTYQPLPSVKTLGPDMDSMNLVVSFDKKPSSSMKVYQIIYH